MTETITGQAAALPQPPRPEAANAPRMPGQEAQAAPAETEAAKPTKLTLTATRALKKRTEAVQRSFISLVNDLSKYGAAEEGQHGLRGQLHDAFLQLRDSGASFDNAHTIISEVNQTLEDL